MIHEQRNYHISKPERQPEMRSWQTGSKRLVNRGLDANSICKSKGYHQ